MKYVFLLSKENLSLAKQEVLSLLDVKKYISIKNLLITDRIDNKISRLAYTRKAYQLLFKTNKKDLIKKIKDFDWQSIYEKDFCVRVHRLEKEIDIIPERKIAAIIWNKLKLSNPKDSKGLGNSKNFQSNPKVNLTNPKTSIEFLLTKNKIYAAKLIKELKQDFESRKAHKRPELHPTALHPKLARALINLSGAEKEIMDPFCGAGGILIEGGLMNLRPIGYDLYKVMLKRAKINLDYFKIKNYKLINQDALKIKKKYDYIVSDLPYGLNTSIWVSKEDKNKKISLKQTNKKEKLKNLEDFYLEFLKNLKKIMKKKAAIIFPHYVNYKKLIKKANLKLEKEFSQYIHRSLTRKIVVLS